MNLADILDELESNASIVNDFILSNLEGQPKDLYRAAAHYIVTGGKRLRPFLVIKSCEMFGGNAHMAMPAAAAVELIHNFSLVHDDIMDNDNLRHGVATVHKSYGIALAILAGDILFSKAFQMIAVEGRKAGVKEKGISEMISNLATACISVCEGQALDVNLASIHRFCNEEHYLGMVGKKTAALFDLSCSMGVLSAPKSSENDVKNLSSFGKNIGIAFQLVDDLIGIVGNPKVTGKSVGNDLREGKKTYPILLALKNIKGNDRDRITRVFGTRDTSDLELREAVRIISESGIEREIRQMATSHIETALQSINNYSDSEAKRALQSSAYFIVERSL